MSPISYIFLILLSNIFDIALSTIKVDMRQLKQLGLDFISATMSDRLVNIKDSSWLNRSSDCDLKGGSEGLFRSCFPIISSLKWVSQICREQLEKTCFDFAADWKVKLVNFAGRFGIAGPDHHLEDKTYHVSQNSEDSVHNYRVPKVNYIDLPLRIWKESRNGWINQVLYFCIFTLQNC